MARRRAPPSAEKRREYNYRFRYGISVEEYEAKLTAQEGVCAICSKPPKRGRLHVDHDHGTGRIRDLLCIPCNRDVGHLEDHVWLARATDYQKRHHPERYMD